VAAQEPQPAPDLPPAKADIIFLVFFDLHSGQETASSLSEEKKIFSNS
jgi:hypothetical protein